MIFKNQLIFLIVNKSLSLAPVFIEDAIAVSVDNMSFKVCHFLPFRFNSLGQELLKSKAVLDSPNLFTLPIS